MRLTLPVILVLLATSSAGVTNVTIDDEFGDPTTGAHITYFPSAYWQQGDECKTCSGPANITDDVYKGTWHNATFYPSNTTVQGSNKGQIIGASVNFTGIAVFVNCILTRSNHSPIGNTDLTFYLDGKDAFTFRQQPNGDATYDFNQTVYSATGLRNVQHNIRLETGHAGQQALVLLDSIIYTSANDSVNATAANTTTVNTTTSISTTTSSVAVSSTLPPTYLSPPPPDTSVSGADSNETNKKTNVGAIVGPVVAGVVVGIVAGTLFCLRRRHERQTKLYEPSPFEQPSVRPYLQHPMAFMEGGMDPTISPYDLHSSPTYVTQALISSAGIPEKKPAEKEMLDPPRYRPRPYPIMLQEPKGAKISPEMLKSRQNQNNRICITEGLSYIKLLLSSPNFANSPEAKAVTILLS
ncbi:uncharacterized protein FOMMEDRAFT_30583 [Fomitiporia mediterranea MF3/22]|uniref:uncharacterized protein n=1 Tax=Fomitiporia mediterranea (strain MF3/22) TaxID=694068 RepID=UPI00044075F3|nr:uncharacterized protein FOMMEDRAFT_30583 [Fomitiporia mediterranea MF3/22]EJD00600.1 hypothetical protein FOMMEDRAFT_30583 [Fomitiporia mediterranea MF3/22]